MSGLCVHYRQVTERTTRLQPDRGYFCHRSVGAGAPDHGAEGGDQDRQVHRKRPVLDIEEVLADGLLPRQVRAPVDLPTAGDPRLDQQPAVYVRLILRDLVRERWARTNERHVSTDDIDQLRELVERPLSQEPTDRGDPRVVADLEHRAVALVEMRQLCLARLGVAEHRAKLEDG